MHWNGREGLELSRGILPIASCLADILRCQPADIAFAVVESALRQRRLTRDQRDWLTRVISGKHRRLLREARASSDSGSESLFRFRMLLLGVTMQSQVDVPGVGRVDFVIGDRLLVEIDSQGYHGERAQRLRDLRRDAIASGLGFICLRFDYDQILYDWATVEATMMAIIDRGDHLRVRRLARPIRTRSRLRWSTRRHTPMMSGGSHHLPIPGSARRGARRRAASGEGGRMLPPGTHRLACNP